MLKSGGRLEEIHIWQVDNSEELPLLPFEDSCCVVSNYANADIILSKLIEAASYETFELYHLIIPDFTEFYRMPHYSVVENNYNHQLFTIDSPPSCPERILSIIEQNLISKAFKILRNIYNEVEELDISLK